jgi:hypothetical protein
MKTLEMLFKAESDGKLYSAQGERFSLTYSKNNGIEKFASDGCFILPRHAVIRFLDLDNWKEVCKVSDDEKVILRNLKGKWLARDMDNGLYEYDTEPVCDSSGYWQTSNDYCKSLEAVSHLFQMVKSEAKEPTLIADLLKG